ncbi:hypothetical protein [Rubellicoccus peritrichatus]|uniref:Uncharacterized protein n=1 Tax=Rubellicoccus peritrichatus TaxID=3080537 RepID=A0AAQ3QUW9_9BACT|nr:hypothetical protein [Puniceicoccus sp. CR14]WOO40863.1 hypothetical protein RZN69_19745 [Puniceicoccus sp. CR14]
MKHLKSFIAITPLLALISTSNGATDDFTSYANGTALSPSNGWSAKWDSTNATQQDLYTVTDGVLTLDTSVAWRNYHALNQSGITMSTDKTAILSAEFRYHHTSGGNITTNFNQSAFGLMISDDANWYSGKNAYLAMSNRGGAIGNPLPIAPWIEGWQTHTSLGVDTTAGGTSEWIRIEWKLTDNGTEIEAVGDIYNATTGALLYTTTTYTTGIASGSTIYGGFSTAWNGIGDVPIESFSKFDAINIDNFSFALDSVPAGSMIIIN